MKDYKGFYHRPDPALVREYRRWTPERRLAWLAAGNRLRRLLPREIVERQERFRRGDI